MIVSFHANCSIFRELSTPAWQNEVRRITFQFIEAMEEAKRAKNGLKLTPCSWLTIDLSLRTNLVVTRFFLFASLRHFSWWQKSLLQVHRAYFFYKINADSNFSPQNTQK